MNVMEISIILIVMVIKKNVRIRNSVKSIIAMLPTALTFSAEVVALPTIRLWLFILYWLANQRSNKSRQSVAASRPRRTNML